LLILPVLLCIALAYQAQTHRHKNTIPNVVFVQINVVIQGAGAQGNDGTLIGGKGAILRGGGAYTRGGIGFISEVRGSCQRWGPKSPSPLTSSNAPSSLM
jgi:hypothetical protein